MSQNIANPSRSENLIRGAIPMIADSHFCERDSYVRAAGNDAMMAGRKQQKYKAKNCRSDRNNVKRSTRKKPPGTSKASPVIPDKSDAEELEEQDAQTDGLTELFKCVDQQLRKDATDIAKRVTKQIEKGLTIKQMVDWMKKSNNDSATSNKFEELLLKIEQNSTN